MATKMGQDKFMDRYWDANIRMTNWKNFYTHNALPVPCGKSLMECKQRMTLLASVSRCNESYKHLWKVIESYEKLRKVRKSYEQLWKVI